MPLSPYKSPVLFQGWKVVGALFIVGFMLYGGGLYSFILFVPPLAKEFHWSSAATGGLVSAFWLSAPVALWAAPLIRRFGERRLVIFGVIIEAISLLLIPVTSSLWQMYCLRALAGFGKILFAVTLPVIASKWFSRRYGLAVAIMFSGWALGGLGLSAVTQYFLSTVGWRATSVALAAAQLIIALPVTLWGLRASGAAELGLGLDGASAPEIDAGTQAVPVGDEASSPRYIKLFGELVRHPTFKIIAVASPLYYLCYSGVLVQQAAVIEGSGGTAYAASSVLGLTAGCAALGAVAGGWIFDRFSLAANTLVAFSLLAIGVLCLLVATYSASMAFLITHAVIFGLGMGCGDIFWVTLMKRRIPVGLFTSAWGIWYFLQLVFVVVGSICAGAIFDFTRSYRSMLVAQIVILVIPFSLSLLLASRRVQLDEGFVENIA